MKLDVAELKKRWQARAALAITLESGRIAVGLLKGEAGGARLVQSFAMPLGADAVLADPEKAGKELAAQLDVAGIKERRSVVCVPPGWALTTSAEVPEIGAEDLRGYLELRAEREFPAGIADLRLAHSAYTGPDGKLRATLAAVPAKRIEAVEKMLEAAGCRAVSISLGLDACLPERGSAPAVHFLPNGNHVDLVISAGGGIATLRTLAGSPSSTFDAAAFCREVRITLGRLPEALRQQVREARFKGASPAVETLLHETQPHLHRMGLESATTARAVDPAGAARQAAELHLRAQPVLFDFIVPEPNRWQAMFARFDSRKRRWVVAGVVGLILLPLLAFIVRSRIASSLEAEWTGMKRSVGELEILQGKIRQFRPWFEPAPTSLQILEALMAAFPESGEVWAKSVQISEESKVTCAGFAQNQAAMTAMLDRLRSRPDVHGLQLQQVRGEKPVQFSIVYKWVPKNAQ